MFFFELKKGIPCRDCAVWSRHSQDFDGYDVGYCWRLNRLTLEYYDCSVIDGFLEEIGDDHTTKCAECEFNQNDEICLAKSKLRQDGRRVLDEESCPIRWIYKRLKNTGGNFNESKRQDCK